MDEIWVPLIIVGVFLLLPLLRGRVKFLEAFEGISWLPVPAFLTAAAIFPAYGFRVEVIPLFVFSLVMALPRAALLAETRKAGKRPRYLRPCSRVAFAGLALCLAFALFFSPRNQIEAEPEEIALRDKDSGRSFLLEVYGDPASGRPLLVVFPPGIGSPAAEKVCLSLEAQGFTVVNCVRRGLPGPGELIRRLRAFWGKGDFAASAGRVLEAERQEDILFLLPGLFSHTGFSSFSGEVFLAGYGDSGSALVRMTGEPGFLDSCPGLKGIVGIESPLWSVDQINIPDVPTLFLVSSRLLNPRFQKTRYESLFACLRYYEKPVTLAAIEGAGPLDYAGFALYYPLAAMFFPGFGKRPPDVTEQTALVISRFAQDRLNDTIQMNGVHFFYE